MGWSDRIETWVRLTASELYCDWCNKKPGDVLERALRLGYLRRMQDEADEASHDAAPGVATRDTGC